jgi:hypothetical protein
MLLCGKELVYTCPCPGTLQETEFVGDGINLAEEISRKPRIQPVLLAAFRQVYGENKEHKSEWKALKNLQSD